jgi:hypothetical protein
VSPLRLADSDSEGIPSGKENQSVRTLKHVRE